MNECFLAFDTSCYTTSAAVVSDGRVLFDKRIMLNVEKGGRGLRQSEAVFQHIRNLKSILSDFPRQEYDIEGVAYSEKPRPRDDSYMPVFCVGEAAAFSFAAALGVKPLPLTHQHGHIYSAFFDNMPMDGAYCALHVSGGTLDLLRVDISENIITGITRIGGSLDITCGQLIDRIGVAAGLGFPAGEEMEKLYNKNGAAFTTNIKSLNVNLSGAEAQAMRLLQSVADISHVCSGIIDCAAETLIKLTDNAAAETNIKKFIFTGGVICNRIIREKIKGRCDKKGYECILANKQYSGDNACGLALVAQLLTGSP
jgi:N6-L-threonylcarbamoyladenine synthase